MKQLNRILLIDDDYINNIISEEILRQMDIAREIHISTNGQEALEYIENNCLLENKQFCADLILLDLNMPVMNGFEFLEKLATYGFHDKINIAILTTSGDSRDLDIVTKYEILGFINKPLTSDKLYQVLNNADSL